MEQTINTTTGKSTNSTKSKKNTERCELCDGAGFVKYEPIYVNGIKYIPCAPCGTIRKPYDICDPCYGTGKKDYDFS